VVRAALLCYAAATIAAAATGSTAEQAPAGAQLAAEAEVRSAAAALHAAQLRLAGLRSAAGPAAAGEEAQQHWAGLDPLPPGNYTKTCAKCGRMGTALWCTCGTSAQQTALSLEACADGTNATIAEIGGFLTVRGTRGG
jgi:hypothetical protein